MSDPRYVIVDLADYSMMMPAKRTNLPDAEHIHFTRHPDGTITAVPMEYHGHKHRPSQTTWIYGPERPPTADEIVVWVDCPTGGDQ